MFLWKPIFAGKALLPGDYLAKMAPWSSVIKAPNPEPQWNPLQWDAIAQFHPWRVFYARSMQSGYIPLWNPHQFSGTPFLANGQSAVLYPPNLLFLVLDPITAFTVLAALHLFLAASFMYMMLRDLGCKELGGIVGGICFAFSAFMVLWLELPTFVAVATWLPLVLLLIHRSVERRSNYYAMVAGAAMGVAILGGHFQIALYVMLAAVLWWLWNFVRVWREDGQLYAAYHVAAPCLVFLVIAGLIAAPQVLPSMELAQVSHRAGGPTAAGYDWFLGNALKPYRLITAFAPDFFGNPSKNNYYLLGMLDGHAGSAADYIEYGMYIGILPLMLAVIALTQVRKRRHMGFFAILALIAILIATGTPINAVFYYLIPGFSSFGGPNRILLLYLFGVAALAGFGIDCYNQLVRERIVWRRGKEVSGATPSVISALLIISLAYGALRSMTMYMLPQVVQNQIAYGSMPGDVIASVFLLAAVVIFIARVGHGMSESLFAVMAVAIIVGDLFAFGINYNPTCERSKVYPRTQLTDTLKKVAGNSRIASINPNWSLFETPNAILPPNAAMVYGLYDVQGYDSLFLRAYQGELARTEGVDPSPAENGNMLLLKQFPGDALRSHFAVHYVITRDDLSAWSPDRLKPDVLEMLGESRGVRLYRLGLPARLSRGHGPDPRKHEGPNQMVVRNLLPIPLIYFLYAPYASYASGWVARTGTRQLHLKPTAGYLSATAVGPGTLVCSYEPFSFRFGLFLMLVSVASLALLGVYRVMRYNHRCV